MIARKFQITLTSRTFRTVRNVIAHNSVQAIRIGLSMMEEFNSPCTITCKPKRGVQ